MINKTSYLPYINQISQQLIHYGLEYGWRISTGSNDLFDIIKAAFHSSPSQIQLCKHFLGPDIPNNV